MMDTDQASPDRPSRLAAEAAKSITLLHREGIVARFLSGPALLDIGYRGYGETDVRPILGHAIGVDLDYPGYDGQTLPFADMSQDAVFSSHCLEHIPDWRNALRDWFRVLRVGGHMVIAVPHQFLYERREMLPSRWNADHQRFYTPASLLAEIEAALAPNSYRVRWLADHDAGYDYRLALDQHPGGSYEIVLVIARIAPPAWILDRPEPPLEPEPEPEPPPFRPTLRQRVLVGLWGRLPASLRARLSARARARGARWLWREGG